MALDTEDNLDPPPQMMQVNDSDDPRAGGNNYPDGAPQPLAQQEEAEFPPAADEEDPLAEVEGQPHHGPKKSGTAMKLEVDTVTKDHHHVVFHPDDSRKTMAENRKRLLHQEAEMLQRSREDAKFGAIGRGASLRGVHKLVRMSTKSNLTGWDVKVQLWKVQVAEILNKQNFDLYIGIIIVANSITIGWESQTEVEDGDTTAFQIIEHFFLIIYVFEIGARFFAFGVLRSLVGSRWVLFDFCLVCVGILSQWIMPLIFTSTPSALEPILVLRVLRLLRLARAVRLIVTFKTLWMLVRGLLTSMDTILFTFLLIFMSVYLTAVLGVEIITKNKNAYADNPECNKIVEENFDSLFSIMLVLLQFVTLDSIGSVYTPLIKFHPALFFYFMPFLLVVSVAMMNLVTAVLVQNAIECSNEDKEVNAAYQKQKLEGMMPEVRKIFALLDEDKSGDISKEEVVKGMTENDDLRKELEHFMGSHSPLQLFEMLDVDGGGLIGIDEFCDAMLARITSDAPIEVTRILKLVTQIKADLQKYLQAEAKTNPQHQQGEKQDKEEDLVRFGNLDPEKNPGSALDQMMNAMKVGGAATEDSGAAQKEGAHEKFPIGRDGGGLFSGTSSSASTPRARHHLHEVQRGGQGDHEDEEHQHDLQANLFYYNSAAEKADIERTSQAFISVLHNERERRREQLKTKRRTVNAAADYRPGESASESGRLDEGDMTLNYHSAQEAPPQRSTAVNNYLPPSSSRAQNDSRIMRNPTDGAGSDTHQKNDKEHEDASSESEKHELRRRMSAMEAELIKMNQLLEKLANRD